MSQRWKLLQNGVTINWVSLALIHFWCVSERLQFVSIFTMVLWQIKCYEKTEKNRLLWMFKTGILLQSYWWNYFFFFSSWNGNSHSWGKNDKHRTYSTGCHACGDFVGLVLLSWTLVNETFLFRSQQWVDIQSFIFFIHPFFHSFLYFILSINSYI